MRIPTPLYALGAAAAMTLLAGCSGTGSPSIAPQNAVFSSSRSAQAARGPISMIPKEMLSAPRVGLNLLNDASPADAAAKQGVYIGQFSSTSVNEYQIPNPTNKAPFCMVSGVNSVNGLGVQPGTRMLYIPDGGSRTIITHKAACGAAGPVLSDPNGQPSDVAFNDKNGAVYVSDIFNTNGAPGTINYYKKGATSPTGQLSDPAFFELLGIETDKAGNVWQDYLTSSGAPGLIVFNAGKMPGHIHAVTGLTRPGGIEFDKAKNMIIVDINTTTPAAYVYKPPYTGAPFKTIVLKGGSVFCKLDVANKNLYIADFTNGSYDVYKYPTGTYEYSVTNGLSSSNSPEGVGVDLPDTD